MGASNYTRNNVLNALLRGVTFPLPTGTYVALHTADPGFTGASEVSTTDWPAYVRRKAEGTGAIGSGWTASTAGSSTNTNQLTYPGQDGASSVTITHYAIWDALSGGNCLDSGQLKDINGNVATRTLSPGDVFVFDVGTITNTMS
ncbi:MAG TPA: hypothetical protein VJ652_15075 [Noviherbaspirillum sp.]|nr:hypothetical protein [Noviherbaspirillum sp.]